jgi:hypothetical protein
MTETERIIAATPLNIADPVQFGAEEYWCAMKVLDDMKIPRKYKGEELSLVGRIKLATGTLDV